MGQAEFRTVKDSTQVGASKAAGAQVTTLFPSQPALAAEPRSDVNPKARRMAALVFLGGVAAFWGTAAAAASAYLF